MTKDEMEIMSALRAKLADKVGRQRYELWFENGAQLARRDGQLVIEAPSPFVRDLVRQQFRVELEALSREFFDGSISIDYTVNEALPPAAPPTATRRAAPRKPCATTSSISCGAVEEAAEAAPPASKGRGTFADFVVGMSNKLAVTSAQLAVERPGSISPLVVHGPTGCGKTHLLGAIRAAAVARNAKLHAVYLTAEQFTTYFLEALGGKGLPNFRRKYRGVDLLIIDDVQFFAGKRATLVELLYTIDTLLQQGKQLVFSSDRPPHELTGLGPELSARLSGGLVCRIEQPDFEMRQGIVDVLGRRMGVSLPAEVQNLVAAYATSHAREISGALNRLQATSLAMQRPITTQMAEEALADLSAQTSRVVRLHDIQRAVCEVFGIEPESLQSDRKAKSVSYPRMLAMFLARKHTRAALSEIGYYFGRRSHSTVISANKKVAAWMSSRQTVAVADGAWNVEEALRKVELQLKAG